MSLDTQIQEMLVSKGYTNNKVTPEKIDSVIESHSFYVFPNTTTTVCCIKLVNGYTVTGESACVDPKNFDQVKGESIAYDNAKDKIWLLEGYLLQHLLNKADQTIQNLTAVELQAAKAMFIAVQSYWHTYDGSVITGWDAAAQEDRLFYEKAAKIALAFPEQMPEMLHNEAMGDLALQGWVYGEVYNEEAKTNPTLVPYTELPVQYKVPNVIMSNTAQAVFETFINL